ncbi:hypothetical protein ACHAWF_009627 [Thalassiosira exigua]
MAPPPPPPPPPGGAYGGSGSYYGSNAGSTSSAAARQRLGLGTDRSRPRPTSTSTAAPSSSDDWFAAPSPAPAPAAAPPPAAPTGSSSGFYSASVGGGGDSMYGNYGAPAAGAYGGGAPAPSGGSGGYYGASGYGGGAGSSSLSGAIGGAPPPPTAPRVPPASAFGSNPNSGSGSFEQMSGAMGGPIGGGPSPGGASPAPGPADRSAASAPHVFDPNAAAAKRAEESKSGAGAMQSLEEDYENEPPLLEELGVNFPHIYSKSRAVLLPFGSRARSMDHSLIEDDADLAGPLAFLLGLGGELLLAGKMHFGYVYGFSVSGCLAMTLLLNLLNPHGAVSAWTVVSILGYALLPVNLLAGINVFLRVQNLGKVGTIMAVLTIAWCTAASARLFERGCQMREQRFLVAYPTALLYSAFVMITIF